MTSHFFAKSSLALAVAAFIAGGAYARTLTPDEALSRALESTSTNKTLRSVNKNSLKLEYTAKTGEVTSAYVFAGPTSYIIAGADDKAAPILGYSNSTLTGEMPPQMKWWLDQYAQEIASASSFVSDGTHQTSRPQRTPIPELLSTKWNQDAPYNDKSPAGCPSGCVATAMTQIMKYHQWPNKGTGTGHYTVSGSNQTEVDLNVTFKWADMLNTYAQGSYTSAQGKAVAELMYAAAASVYMDFAPGGSGAQSSQVPIALKTNFDYDQAARSLDRTYYTLAEWEEIIYNELAANRPVYYSGADMSAGHAFVCDGYQGDGFFHFNWGWGGYYDGYFMLTGLKPDGSGIGGNSGGYNLWQAIVVGIQKNTGVPYETPVNMGIYGNITSEVNGDMLTLYTSAYNYTGRTLPIFDQGYGVKVAGSDEAPAYTAVWTTPEELPAGYGYAPFVASVDLSNLDKSKRYEISNGLRLSGTSEWIAFTHPLATVPYVIAYYEDGSWKSQDFTSALPTVEFFGISTSQAGQKFNVNFDLINNQPVEVATGVAAMILNKDTHDIIATTDAAFIDMEIGDTGSFTVSSDDNNKLPAAGKYLLAIVAVPSYEIIKEYEFATGSLSPALVSCSSFTLEGDNTKADLSSLTFNMTLKASRMAFTNPLTLTFYHLAEGAEVSTIVTTRVLDGISIPTNADKTISETFNLSGAPSGEYSVILSTLNGSGGNRELATLSFTTGTSGIETAAKTVSAYFDRATSTVIAYDNSDIEVFAVSGQAVARGKGTLNIAGLSTGMYIVRVSGNNADPVVIKIMK